MTAPLALAEDPRDDHQAPLAPASFKVPVELLG